MNVSYFPQLKHWMIPVFDRDMDGTLYVMFYTSNGYRHDIRCRWNSRINAWTIKFRGSTWIASTKTDPLA